MANEVNETQWVLELLMLGPTMRSFEPVNSSVTYDEIYRKLCEGSPLTTARFLSAPRPASEPWLRRVRLAFTSQRGNATCEIEFPGSFLDRVAKRSITRPIDDPDDCTG